MIWTDIFFQFGSLTNAKCTEHHEGIFSFLEKKVYVTCTWQIVRPRQMEGRMARQLERLLEVDSKSCDTCRSSLRVESLSLLIQVNWRLFNWVHAHKADLRHKVSVCNRKEIPNPDQTFLSSMWQTFQLRQWQNLGFRSLQRTISSWAYFVIPEAGFTVVFLTWYLITVAMVEIVVETVHGFVWEMPSTPKVARHRPFNCTTRMQGTNFHERGTLIQYEVVQQQVTWSMHWGSPSNPSLLVAKFIANLQKTIGRPVGEVVWGFA